MKKIGFIGLGIMGSRMAANLKKAGFELVVYNRTAAKADQLVEEGAFLVDSPEEVGKQCDVVFTMLSSPEVVKETVLGAQGLFSGMNAGGLWVDCSTVNPSFTKEMASHAVECNVRFVDAPVAGTKMPAEKGELVFFAAGTAEDVESCKTYFDVMGKKTIYMGENGKGSAVKMLVNQLLGQSMEAFAEAMALGKAMGLDRETLFNILLNTPVVAPFLAAVRPKLESGDYEPNFPLKWMHKDLHLAAATAFEYNVPAPSLNAVKEVYSMANKNGAADEDFSSIFKFLMDD